MTDHPPELVMSNFDGLIPDGMAGWLRDHPGEAGEHTAWDHYGEVRWDPDGQVFQEQVFRYGQVVKVVSAPTLDELMRDVNDEFGWK